MVHGAWGTTHTRFHSHEAGTMNVVLTSLSSFYLFIYSRLPPPPVGVGLLMFRASLPLQLSLSGNAPIDPPTGKF